MDEKFTGNQVVTELDAMRAVCDYIDSQLCGRFRIQFPDIEEIVELVVYGLRNAEVRSHPDNMYEYIAETAAKFGSELTVHKLLGCEGETNHAFMREFINLVWDARDQTAAWLKGQGIVPGRSAN